MTIGRLLNQMIHACVALSIAAYALAAEQPTLLLIMLALLGLEFSFVSRVGGRPLPRLAVNTALALATTYVVFELMTGGEGREFVSVIGRYLIWLQLIKLAEPKTARNLGQALALTAMLAVGAVLTNVALIVGALLLIYIPLFLATVVVFQVYSGHAETYGIPLELGGHEQRGRTLRRRPTRDATADDEPIHPAPRHTTSARPRAGIAVSPIDRLVHARWSRRPARPLFASQGLARQLGATVVLASVAILIGSVAMFLAIPRGIGESIVGGRLPTAAGGPRVTGFSPDLQLGGAGVISESSAIALYARFSRDGNILGDSNRAWYLRGYTMDRYDAARGRWIRSDRQDAIRLADDPRFDPRPRGGDLIQEITIRNHRSDYLFSVLTPVAVESLDTAILGRNSIRADGTIRLRGNSDGLLSYTVRSRDTIASHEDASEPIEGGNESLDRDHDDAPDEAGPSIHDHEPAERTRDDPHPLQRRRQFEQGPIADLAASIAEQAGVPIAEPRLISASQRRTLARAIEDHLAIRCAYTLDQPPISADEDPIESFLFRTRRGHCEYFASASAALANAMGLPARVVTGYHVREWDPNARRYIVRESSAHAWTEIELSPGDWIIIDPSAEDVRQLNRPPTGLVAGVRRLIDQIEFLWVSRVVTFDSPNQRRLFSLDFSRAREALEALNRRAADLLNPSDDPQQTRGAMPRSIRILVNALLIIAMAGTLGTIAVLAWRWAARLGLGRPAARPDDINDPRMRRRLRFYPAMLRRLRRSGNAKPEWSPPALHAARLDRDNPSAAGTIRRLTDLYYAERFGGRSLSDDELAEAHRLVRLIPERRSPATHSTTTARSSTIASGQPS